MRNVRSKKRRVLGIVAVAALLCLWFVTRPGISQQTLHSMYHQGWTIQQGAPSNIQSVRLGPDGMLWMVTDDGFYRFDGQSFDRYAFPPDRRLKQPINTMDIGDDGSLWLGFTFGGLARVRNHQVRIFTDADGMPKGQIHGITAEADATWFCSSVGLISVVGDRILRHGEAEGLPARQCIGRIGARDHNEWIVYTDGLFLRTPGQQKFVRVWSEASGIDWCTESQVPGLWCLTMDHHIDHLILRNGALVNDDIQQAPPGTYALDSRSDGFLYVITNSHGLYRVSEKQLLQSGKFLELAENYDAKDGLTDSTSGPVFLDKEGSLWVSTISGINQFRPKNFHDAGLGPPYALIPASGTRGTTNIVGKDRVYDIDTHKPITPAFKNYIAALYRALDQSLWVSDCVDLYHVDSKGHVQNVVPPFDINNPPANRCIRAFTQDEIGDLWASVNRLQVYAHKDGAWVPGTKYGLPNIPAVSAYRDSAGVPWFGYMNNLIAKVAAGRATIFSEKDGLQVGITSVFAELRNNLLVGGTAGVAMLKGAHFYPLVLLNGDLLRTVTGIAVDPSGDLWLNSANGVVRIPAADIDAFVRDPAHRVQSEVFDFHDGVTGTTNPLMVDSAWMGANGLLYVLTRSNAQTINPEKIHRNTVVPKVYVTAITSDAIHSDDPADSFITNKKPQSIAIRYTTSSHLIPDRVRFRYMLEGYDKDWVEAGTRRTAFYSHLPPGHYTFRVTACNDSGVWNEKGTSLAIFVPPTFMQTRWFTALLVTVALLLAFLLYRLQLESAKQRIRERLLARSAERERIARELHDSFFPGVEALLLHIHAASSKLPLAPSARASINDAFDQADGVMAQGRGLVYDLRQTDKEEDFEQSVRSYVDNLGADTRSQIEITKRGNDRLLEPTVAAELLSVAKEAIWNAIRHAEATRIIVAIEQRRDSLVICIDDDGTGIDVSVLERGYRPGHFGLQGMRERADKLRAKFEIKRASIGGTRVCLRVPASIAYVSKTNQVSSRWFGFFTPSQRGDA